MNINEVVFTSYAFGDLYVRQQERLRQSILKIYPEANIRFWASESGDSDNDLSELPPGSKTFKESMYGFKVHCVKNCLKEGFKVVIYLDTAIVLENKIDSVLEFASKVGVAVPIDRSSLSDRVSDKALAYCNKTREEISDLTIVGGSLFIFDFNNILTPMIFGMWADMEAKGLFGSEHEAARGLLQGHRHDEACMSLCLNVFGSKPFGFEEVGYHNLGNERKGSEVFTFYKLHFKGIGVVAEHSVDLSMLPIKANVLDLGCRGFGFTDKLRELEHNVYPVDIGKSGEVRLDKEFYRIAISDSNGRAGVSVERDPEATNVIEGDEVEMMTLESFSDYVGVSKWHLIKMDIEGSEMGILKNATHPIADQVSVEFHAHCGHKREDIDNLLNYLEQWYFIHNRVWEEGHGAGFNYWDVLLIAK